jgi:hypothetical protein
VVEEVEAEIRQVEKELAEVERKARRVGAKRRAEELSAIRDILYEDKWFRIATVVFYSTQERIRLRRKGGRSHRDG